MRHTINVSYISSLSLIKHTKQESPWPSQNTGFTEYRSGKKQNGYKK